MKVFMPDGTEYQTTIERTTNVETKATNGLPPYGSASTMSEPGPRTLVTIATELDAAQNDLQNAEAAFESAQRNRADWRANVAELTKELRTFGVKKRAPKGKP